jgi:hypothetical protein
MVDVDNQFVLMLINEDRFQVEYVQEETIIKEINNHFPHLLLLI